MTKPYRVLVVDDEPNVVRNLSLVLEAAGIRVSSANHGALALQRLALEPDFDLVLTDVMMPVMDGFELLSALRANPVTADLPVVVMSAPPNQREPGLDLEVRRVQCRDDLAARFGPCNFIHSPVRPAELVAIVESLLRRE